MGNVDVAGVQVQALLDAARERPVDVVVFILRIADDRVADVQRMHAQLVRAAGIGFHLQPGHRLCRGFENAVEGDRMIGAFLAVPGDPHPVTVRRLLLHKPGRNLVFVLAGHALDQRPVGLFRIALAKGRRQLLRSTSGTGNHQHAGGVAVEPMHEPGLLALRAGPGVQHLVNMPRDAGAALHRKAGWFVEHNHLVVLMQHHALQKLVVAGMLEILAGNRAGLLGIDVERRYAHRLSRLNAGIRFHPAAIDTHLAGTQQLLERPECEAGIMDLEPAVEAHARFVRLNADVLDACHDVLSSSIAFSGCLEHRPAKRQPAHHRNERDGDACDHIGDRRGHSSSFKEEQSIQRKG